MERKIYVIFIFILVNCCSTNQRSTISSDQSSIEASIIQAKIEISRHLRRNGVDHKNMQMVIKATGRYQDYDGKANDKGCEIFQNRGGYEVVSEKVAIGNNWITAMLIDNENNYLLKSSTHTINSNPEQLNAYRTELALIDLARKNKYITFIELMNCDMKFVIGYKKGVIDVYQYDGNEITLVYSK